MKKVFYLTSFLSLCCFCVGKSNTLLLKKEVNVTNPHLNLLNKIRYNSIIGQKILEGEKYKIEHELKNLEGIVSNIKGKSLLSTNSVLIKSDKNIDDFHNNTPTITEAFYFPDINDTLGCIQGNCKNRYGTFIWSNGFKFKGYFKKRKPYDGDLYIFRGEKTISRSIVAGIKIPFGRVDIKNIGTISGNFINGEIIKGKFKSSDGYNEYDGEFKDDKFNGQGSLTSKNGDKYVGGFKVGKYEGQGTLTNNDGSKYVGGFKEGKKSGQGTFTDSWGDNYVGGFLNDLENGQGTLTNNDGSKYVGGFKEGKKSGQGTFKKLGYNPGKIQIYVGEFKNGKYEGQGTLTREDGLKYVGGFKEGKKSGQGTWIFSNGDKYFGEHINDKLEGQGTVIYSNGDKFVGELDIQQLHVGTMVYSNGDKYEGEFSSNRRHGEGIMIYTNGDKYVGRFQSDKKSLQGTMTYSNGSKYVGEWWNDKKSGQGTFTHSNGEKNIGKFEDDNYINQEKLDNDALIKNTTNVTNSTLNNSSISSFGNGLVRCKKCGKSFRKNQGFCKMAGGTGSSSPCAQSYADIELGFVLYKDRPDILDYYMMALNTGIWVCTKSCSAKIYLCID